MNSSVSHKVVSVAAAGVLVAHAIFGVIHGSIRLKGATELSLAADPISFISIISIEIAVSIYVVWAFVFANGKEENKAD